MRVVILPKYFNAALYFAPVPSKEFLAYICLAAFHFQFIFMLLESTKSTILLYLCIMLFWGQLQPALWCKGFLVICWRPIDAIDIFHPVVVVVFFFFLYIYIFTIFIPVYSLTHLFHFILTYWGKKKSHIKQVVFHNLDWGKSGLLLICLIISFVVRKF